MKKIMFLMGVFFYTSFVNAADYTLTGQISGYYVLLDKCYASIHDEIDNYHADQWHSVDNEHLCETIKMAYLLNTAITANVDVIPAVESVNNIKAVKTIRCEINWAPYHNKDNKNCGNAQ